MTCAASKDDFSVTIRNGTILIWRQMWVNVQTVQETDAPRVMSRFLNLGAVVLGVLTVKPRAYRNRPKADVRDNLHPLVIELYKLVETSGLPQVTIARVAGYNDRILTEWKRRDTPMLAAFDHVLRALGKKLVIMDL